jgi:hypothetical protein
MCTTWKRCSPASTRTTAASSRRFPRAPSEELTRCARTGQHKNWSALFAKLADLHAETVQSAATGDTVIHRDSLDGNQSGRTPFEEHGVSITASATTASHGAASTAVKSSSGNFEWEAARGAAHSARVLAPAFRCPSLSATAPRRWAAYRRAHVKCGVGRLASHRRCRGGGGRLSPLGRFK